MIASIIPTKAGNIFIANTTPMQKSRATKVSNPALISKLVSFNILYEFEI